MNTTATYLGLLLPHPFVSSASPFGYRLDSIKRLEDAGCAAVVLHSLFEEQITLATTGRIHGRDPLSDEFAGDLADFPGAADYALGPHEYAAHISQVKAAVKMPIIGSLNGASAKTWLTF